jgi:hypothetical protein
MFVLYRGLQCILKTSLNEETKIKIKIKKNMKISMKNNKISPNNNF